MEIQQIRYFLTLARTLNFTRAAEECNVSQSALTRAIQALEAELGGELMRREHSKSHLTELGKRIWNEISKEAWAAWLKHQTMLVNENRLNLADQRARQYLARQMEQYLFGDGGGDKPAGYVPPAA